MSITDQKLPIEVSKDRTLTAGVDDSITMSVSTRDLEYLQSLADESMLNVTDDMHAEGDQHHVVIESEDYAGVVGLPDSDSIYIQPKIEQTALLRLLQLDETTSQLETLGQSAEIAAGNEFVDLLAKLYSDELASVLRQGVERSYKRVESQEEYVRGRLNAQQQLQESGPVATKFHCSHDQLTRDTALNRTVLYAANVLVRVAEDTQTQRRLRQQVQQLRREITLTEITYRQAKKVKLTRLTMHYGDLLRLAKLVIRNTRIEDLYKGEALAYTLLLDMPDQYQDALIAPLREIDERYSLRTEPQLKGFISGDFSLDPKPDYVLYQDGNPVLVLDAKWKDFSDDPDSKNIYQMVAYQQHLDVPGVLLYPDTGDETQSDSPMKAMAKNGYPVIVGRVPVADPMDSLSEYRSNIIETLDTCVSTALTE